VIVVDTSVALKWFVREEGSEAAAGLVGTDMVAPELLTAELGNALWKKWRRREIAQPQAAQALLELPDIIELLDASALVDRAFEIACELEHPVYDCHFLALAEQVDCSLVTSDTRFARTCDASPYAGRIELLEGRP
jgi:predicted nucleic acid-binding protein